MDAVRPNILFIFTDQQSANMLSCAGNTDLRTPNLDRLAARGIRFERAYCAQPLCVPSRGAMSTGLYPHQFDVPFNWHPHERVACDGIPWVGRLLADAGYDTAYYGKWHQPVMPDRHDTHGWHDVQYVPDEQLPALCRKFFERDRDRPFFLTVSFLAPHEICESARDADLPGGNIPPPTDPTELPDLPDNFAPPDDEPDILREIQKMSPRAYPTQDWDGDRWRLHRWMYSRLVERVDARIGAIIDCLDAQGLADHTIIVFTADHGDGQAAHRWNQKQVLYEESTRVPFLLCDPSRPHAGTVNSTHLINTGLDLAPTFCDYAGLPVPAEWEGLSLRSFTNGDPVPWRGHLVIETEFGIHSKPFDIGGRAVYTTPWKYMVYSHGEKREQLVDLDDDPGEMVNRANDPACANILARHRDLLQQWCRATNDPRADMVPRS